MTENTSPGGNRADADAGATANGHRSRADDLLAAMPADFGKATARRRDDDAHTRDDDGKTDVNGLRPGDEGYQPFNTRGTNAKHAAAAKAQEASEKRLKRWASRRYPLRVLDVRTEPSARTIAAEFARRNAGRDPVKNAPEVMFSGDKAVNAGATDAALTALPSLTPDEIAALRIEAAAALEATRMQVRQLGRRIAAEHDAAVPLDGVPAEELAEWLAVARLRAGEAVSTPAPADTPPDPVPLASVAHGPETVPSDDADDDPAPDIADEPAVVAVVHPVPTSPRPDRYDATAAWLAGGTRRY